jgi:hypothetical protein
MPKSCIYFSVHITYNEYIQLQKSLASDVFCIFRTDEQTNLYYGAIYEEAFHSLLYALEAETLEKLEYLGDNEFQLMAKGERCTVTGNEKLLE